MSFLNPENLKPLLELLERFGWPLVALAGLSWVILRTGRAIAAGLCYAWARVEPYITGILSSHSDLMDTARDQMPKQTAILRQLSEGHIELRGGQKSHEEILKAIRDSVNRITPVDTATPSPPPTATRDQGADAPRSPRPTPASVRSPGDRAD